MANITRYSPFEDLFNEFTRGFYVRPLSGFPAQGAPEIKLDVKEHDKDYTVRAEIPGVKKEDIHVDVEGSYGAVSRDFELPTDVDSNGAKAEYKDGVLNLTLPKKAGAATHRISVA